MSEGKLFEIQALLYTKLTAQKILSRFSKTWYVSLVMEKINKLKYLGESKKKKEIVMSWVNKLEKANLLTKEVHVQTNLFLNAELRNSKSGDPAL